VADPIEQLQARLAARMRELNIAPDDARIVPLFAQVQKLVESGVLPLGLGMRANSVVAHGSESAVAFPDLTTEVRQIVQAYIEEQSRLPWYGQAPALSASAAGRNLLQLEPLDRSSAAVAAYGAWTSERSTRLTRRRCGALCRTF
jgi:hypothetical protein